MSNLRPFVIVYELDRLKYAHLADKYRFTFFKPNMYRIPETRFNYFVTHSDKIRADYAEVSERSPYDIKELVLVDGELVLAEEHSEVSVEAPESVIEPVKEESNTNVPVEEDNGSESFSESDSEEEKPLEELSWFELRAKAASEGLEGRFSKDEALEFLRNK